MFVTFWYYTVPPFCCNIIVDQKIIIKMLINHVVKCMLLPLIPIKNGVRKDKILGIRNLCLLYIN